MSATLILKSGESLKKHGGVTRGEITAIGGAVPLPDEPKFNARITAALEEHERTKDEPPYNKIYITARELFAELDAELDAEMDDDDNV